MEHFILVDEFPKGMFIGRKGIVIDVVKKIREKLKYLSKGEVLVVDMSEIELLDFSFAHELILNTLLLLGKGVFEDKYLVFYNPSSIVFENLEAALKLSKFCAIILYPDDNWNIAGLELPEHFLEPLNIVMSLGEADVLTITRNHQKEISQNNCNNRLKQLYNYYKLIHRKKENHVTGGNFYIYKSLLKKVSQVS